MSLLALGMPGPFELILLTGLGLLFFGRRLPEVGKSIGQTIVQFKKGLNEVKEEVSTSETKALPAADQHKFDPQTGEPIKS